MHTYKDTLLSEISGRTESPDGQTPIPIIEETPETLREDEHYPTAIGDISPEKVYLVSAPENTLRRDASLTLAIDAAKELKTLYVNTMRSEKSLRKRLADVPEAMNGGRLYIMHVSNGKLPDCYRDIVGMCLDEGIRVLVISSFELAAHTSRHRELLAIQLNQLCTDHGMIVVVFTKEKMERLRKKQEYLTGAIGLLLSFSEPPIDVGGQDDLEEPGYIQLMREKAEEDRIKEKDKPDPKGPKDPKEYRSYYQRSYVPVEQVLPESDWDNPLYTQYADMRDVIAELRFKKEHGMLRMDPYKNREYYENHKEYNAQFEAIYGSQTKSG